MKSTRFQSKGLALLLIGAHVLGGSVTGVLFPPGEWIGTLAKPAFYPPAWIFPTVWPLLYAAMGFALWLALRASVEKRGLALLLYFSQLVVNYSFSPLFFGLKNTLLGFLVVALLLPLLTLTVVSFYRISRLAAVLLVPYLIWVSFACALSFSIWRLNA